MPCIVIKKPHSSFLASAWLVRSTSYPQYGGDGMKSFHEHPHKASQRVALVYYPLLCGIILIQIVIRQSSTVNGWTPDPHSLHSASLQVLVVLLKARKAFESRLHRRNTEPHLLLLGPLFSFRSLCQDRATS